MDIQQSKIVVSAPLRQVRELLLQPLALPEWNSAFISLTGSPRPVEHEPYRLTVRGGLTGTFRYEHIGAQHITASWQVPGFHESANWTFTPDGPARTHVSHEFEHRGPLARLMSGAFRGVAELRLQRLAERATSAHGLVR